MKTFKGNSIGTYWDGFGYAFIDGIRCEGVEGELPNGKYIENHDNFSFHTFKNGYAHSEDRTAIRLNKNPSLLINCVCGFKVKIISSK